LDDYIDKIQQGWTDIDVIITMPSVMANNWETWPGSRARGLMPNPKSGTVTQDVGKAVEEVKGGKIDFKVRPLWNSSQHYGKISFSADKIAENAREFLQTIIKLKPASAKGTYIKSICLSSTMSPGIRVDAKAIEE
jgi:large subunit ribosomal protein L1